MGKFRQKIESLTDVNGMFLIMVLRHQVNKKTFKRIYLFLHMYNFRVIRIQG